jgi:hypothetical protein
MSMPHFPGWASGRLSPRPTAVAVGSGARSTRTAGAK